MKITLADIEKAKIELAKILDQTPLLPNHWLSQKYGCEVYLKLENMQPVGSFKIRGASYKMSKLTKAQKKKGVVAASAGNHAQGVAWAASKYKIKSTIVMPTNAPLTKFENTKSLGAEVVLEGDNYEAAYNKAKSIVKKTGATFVHPFEDKDVIAGQGTIGLEILEQLPETDVVIGSIGGGGMMAGIGIALKALKPTLTVIGAQASGARSLVESIKKHRITQTGVADTFADGIKVKIASEKMFKILNDVVDHAVHASDEKIAAGVLSLLERARIMTEGAGALPLAALEDLAHTNPKLIKGKKVVLVICGGNIDVNLLSRIIDRGLTMSGRRVRVLAYISDKPGSLSELTQIISGNGVNVLQVIHDRDDPKIGLNETSVELTLETRGPKHSKQLLDALRKRYAKIELLH